MGKLLSWMIRKGGTSLIMTIAVSILAGLAIVYEMRALMRKESAVYTTRILVARRDLAQNEMLHLQDMVPKSRAELGKEVPSDVITDQDIHLLKDTTMRIGAEAGQVLRWEMLNRPFHNGMSSSVPRGYRAYTVLMPEYPPIVMGDKVDILGGSSSARILVEGASVLHVHSNNSGHLAVVAVPPSEVSVLEKARREGKLTIVLRNPGDRIPSRKRLDFSARGRVVEVWADGQ